MTSTPAEADSALRLVWLEITGSCQLVCGHSPGVCLATSYYSDRAEQHATITARPGAHARTTANTAEAVRRSIPLRVGLVDMMDGQRVQQGREQLTALGVMSRRNEPSAPGCGLGQ